MCTFFETFCAVWWTDVFAIPSDGTDIRKSIGLLPSFSRPLCKVLKHLWVPKIEEIVIPLVLINPFQSFLTEGLSIVVHIIGLPFIWVFVTVGNQAAVVPILVYVLHAEKQLACCYLVFQLLLQLQKWYSYNVQREKKTPTLSTSKILFDFPFGPW